MPGRQLKQTRFMFTLFKSHVWYAVFIFAVFSTILIRKFDPVGGRFEVQLWQLIVLLAVVVVSGLLCSWWIARRLTKPLEQMAEIINRMSVGDYSERLQLSGAYELTVIQGKFNAMADSLERSVAENRQLQQNKQRMLADLSHDLKTPITTIQGYAKALETGISDKEEVKERYLKLISDTTAYVAGLIDQIFVLSKLDRPDYPVLLERIDAAELLREIVADYYEQLEREQFTLEVDIPEEEVPAYCDPQLVRRAISNLLSNAIKHNPPGTSVTVRLVDNNDWLQFIVADDGIGIPSEWRDKVVEPFIRADHARQKEGAGLGLSIASQVAKLHGGRLLLHQPEGETTFILELLHKHE